MGLLSRRRARHHSDYRYYFSPDGTNIKRKTSFLSSEKRPPKPPNRSFQLVVERRWREEDFMPNQIGPEYKAADWRSGPNQENTERARAGVTGHNVLRYVLIFGLLAVIIAFAIVYVFYFH